MLDENHLRRLNTNLVPRPTGCLFRKHRWRRNTRRAALYEYRSNRFYNPLAYLETMASPKEALEVYDLNFLDEDELQRDETDAVSTRVIEFEKDSEIPAKYFVRKIFSPHLESPYHYDPSEETPQRRKKLHIKWGTEVSERIHSFHHKEDLIALVSLESIEGSDRELDKRSIHKIAESLANSSGDKELEALRTSGQQLLMKFSAAEFYHTLGKSFLEGKLESAAGFKLVELQSVSVLAPSPCYIEVSNPVSTSSALHENFSSLLVSFCSKFPYITVREPEQNFTNGSPSNSPASKTRRLQKDGQVTIPSVGLMLMYSQRATRNADRLLSLIQEDSANWEKVEVPKEISEGDEVYFKATNHDGPLLAVKKFSPFSGIRLMLNVNKSMEDVESFYTSITKKAPLAYNKIEEGLRYRTFPLSSTLELKLVSHPLLKCHPLKNVSLCFMMNDVNKMCSEIPGGVRNIGEGHWQVRDPEGNSVILYSLSK